MRWLAPAFLIVTLPIHAATSDLHLTLNPPAKWWPGAQLFLQYTVTNSGPDAAKNILLTVTSDPPLPNLDCASGCKSYDVDANGSLHWSTPALTMPNAESVTITATISSDSTDPSPDDNRAVAVIPLVDQPDIAVEMRGYGMPFGPVTPTKPFHFSLDVSNRAAVDAHDVVATVDLPPGTTGRDVPANCTITDRLTCTWDVIAGYSLKFSDFVLIAPARFEGTPLRFDAAAYERETDFDGSNNRQSLSLDVFRMFFVTSTADSGPGTLRDAFDGASRDCTTPAPCMIAFEIREPSETPWKTIHLRSPLRPMLAPYIMIDGAWQTENVGDGNPDGPEIEISGDGVIPGDGITVTVGCRAEVRGLAINGFGGNGVTMIDAVVPCDSYFSTETDLHDLYIGTDPTGTLAKPNGLRGIASYFTRVQPLVSTASIYDCVLSGNARSGIFIHSGSLTIHGNRIGVKAHSDDPLPNGASGIYTAGYNGWWWWTPPIYENVIAFNGDFGLAIDGHAGEIAWDRNRIWGNGNAAVDYGLDNRPTNACQMPAPSIAAMRYDPSSDKTLIEGDIKVVGSGLFVWGAVSFYGSDTAGVRGLGDAQRPIGSVTVGMPMAGTSVPPHFSTSIVGDHRGEWITAALTRYSYESFAKPAPQDEARYFCTTELSLPVQVP